MRPQGDVTSLLQRSSAGEAQALAELLPLLYGELRGLAASYMARQARDHTLQPTALVHEAYLKLAENERLSFKDRASFFALAARAMRQVLVDHARSRGADKRGGGAVKVTLAEGLLGTGEKPADIEALDDALLALAKVDERKSRIVELKYFGGLTGEEIAETLGIGTATVTRELRMAEAWLRREMAGPPG